MVIYIVNMKAKIDRNPEGCLKHKIVGKQEKQSRVGVHVCVRKKVRVMKTKRD